MRTLAIPLLIAAVVAGCNPSRNNPFDPTLAPAAKLDIVDVTLADGTCPADPAAAPATIVFSVSRGRCLALDARATSEPSNVSATFRYSVTDGAGATPQAIAGSGAILSLDHAITYALLSSNVTFSVAVVNALGGQGAAQRTIELTNARPIAVASQPRSLPQGGFPWAPGSSFNVRFNGGASHDPDHDPLLYCWTFSDSTAPEVCSASPFIDHVLPSTPGRTVATLVVQDNATGSRSLRSAPVREILNVRESNGWLNAGTTALRIDSRPPLQIPGQTLTAYYNRGAAEMPSAAVVALIENIGQNDSTYSLRIGTESTNVTLGATAPALGDGVNVALAFDPASSVLWTFTDGLGGTTGTLRSWSVDPIGLTATQTGSDITFATTDMSGALVETRVVVDGSGHPWVERVGDSRVYYYDGNSVVSLGIPGSLLIGAAARPGSTQLWTSWSPDFAGGAPSAAIGVFNGPNLTRVGLSNHDSGAMGWVDGDRLWFSTDAGLLLVNAASFDLNGSFSFESMVPDAPLSFTMIVDPQTSTLFANGSSLAYTADLSGAYALFQANTSPAWFTDVNGAVWFTQTNGPLARADVPSEGGFDAFVPTGSGLAEYDEQTGGIWIGAGLFGVAVKNLAENGALARTISTIQLENGSLASIPVVDAFRPSPGGSRLFYRQLDPFVGSYTGIVQLDLTTDPPLAHTVMDAAHAASLSGTLLEPSAPVPGSTPFLWIFDNASLAVQTLTTNGTPAPIFTLPAGEALIPSKLRGAINAADNSLCLTTVENPNILHTRILRPDGTVVPLGVETAATGATLFAATSPGLCWVAFGDPDQTCNASTSNTSKWHVRAYSTSATPDISYDYNGGLGSVLEGFRADDASSIWAAANECSQPFLIGNIHHVSNPGSNASDHQQLSPQTVNLNGWSALGTSHPGFLP